MTIGIIIPTFDEERILSRTLLYTRQHQFEEILVVDGGSQDHTVQIAESSIRGAGHEHAKVLSSTRGRAIQMNTGAAEARADVLIFLHADTRLPAEARSAIEKALSDPECVGGRFDVRFEEDSGWAWIISSLMNLRSRWSGVATGDHAIFVRRSVFQEMGGFADIPIMEDVEFTHRLKRMGRVAALRAKVTTSFRRWEKNGLVRTILQMWILRFLYWIGLSPRTLHHFYGTIR